MKPYVTKKYDELGGSKDLDTLSEHLRSKARKEFSDRKIKSRRRKRRTERRELNKWVDFL